MALIVFLHTTLLLKVLCLEGLLNWKRIDQIASKRLSNCNLHQLKELVKIIFDI